MKTRIICAGFGGQGALVAGIILAHHAMHHNKNVLWLSSYGGEMRGGSANCSLTISDSEIGSPYLEELDVLVAMNEVSVQKFQQKLCPGGVMVVNTSMTEESCELREDIRVIKVDATNIATSIGNLRGTNIVMLGAMASGVPFIDDAQSLRDTIDSYFTSKGKPNEKNALCFDKGLAGAQ